MNQPQSTPSIVVGIDGSQAAINAARWAVIEASSRDLPLRLVHVIEQGAGSASAADPDIGVEYAETVLREAEAAVHSGTELVKSEIAIVRGSAGSVLINETRHAAMVCSVGDRTLQQHVIRIDCYRAGARRTLPGGNRPRPRRRFGSKVGMGRGGCG